MARPQPPGPDDSNKLVCVDVDGTLRDNDSGQPTPGAVEALQALHAQGYRIAAWTSQSDPDVLGETQRWLGESGIPHDLFIHDRKPPAVAYIDDKAIPFQGDWSAAIAPLIGQGQAGQRGKLHMLIGLPGSGKSTFSRAAIPGAARISHDSIVGAIAATVTGVPAEMAQQLANEAELAMVRAALSLGRQVVLDRLNLTSHHRARWIGLARHCGASIHGYSWSLGLERQWTGNLARRPGKHVDLADFREMADSYEPPRTREGFDTLHNVVEDETGFRELRASVE